ncbi:MAG: NAD(P)/FAD-dependent oxidoreductase [Prevotella sp.]|nr:NAD(P)/FAD-dependent oxidoreductase [Prevotella sp.]
MMRVAIIGAGAAGCFCSICIKRNVKDAEVDVFEAGKRPLAKVAVTGGGRCNLTNSFRDIDTLSQAYPRGDKLMKRALRVFSNEDVMEWFENEGVALVTQEDQCVFPVSQDAMQIVNTLLRLMREEGVRLHLSCRPKVEKVAPVPAVSPQGSPAPVPCAATVPCVSPQGLYLVNGRPYDKLIIAIGGCPKPSRLDFLKDFALDIVSPVPSLFTFNVAGDWHQALMGTVVEDASVMIAGTKFRSSGALLLTHWGMSGPAILRLSSYAARWLNEKDYKCQICVNWCGEKKEDEVRQMLLRMKDEAGQKLVSNVYPRHLAQRHWIVLLDRCNISPTLRWQAMNKKELNRLVTVLTADVYEVTGRCHFKEEFVTAGGVALGNININTLEAKHHPGLFFIGEVLDVDAITGGFNLQAAWSMAWVVAKEVAPPLPSP